MITVFHICNATFVDSNIHEDIPGYPLGSFRVSINGMAKRVYLDWTTPDPETKDRPTGAKRIRARSFSKEAAIIKKLNPDDRMDFVVNVWDATPKDARRQVFSLARIETFQNSQQKHAV
jgi:hypothetical protein